MTIKASYRWLLACILGLVFIAQSFSLAHATRYNDASHEHNGVACEITLTSAEDIALIPVPQIVPEFTQATDVAPTTAFVSTRYVTPQGRAPPPRAPPLTF